MEQIIADIYAVSDKCVVYSNDVRGKFTDELSERFMEEHELLDGIYHFLQNERSIDDMPAIHGRKLFKMSEIPDAKETECEEMAEEIMGDLKFLLKGIESLAKSSDEGVRNYLGGKIQEIKNRIAFYRNFLAEDYEGSEE